ncbi:hypothetical protein [Streptomyces sp. NPDC020480]|uniref:hypothetical protein n=1 Tax=Streptomyces sp. NPDC020480 TaxID=3365076 RepID=UPI0037A9EFBB
MARDMVAGLLAASGHPALVALVETARLLVSEVVANVHLHTKVPLLSPEATIRGPAMFISHLAEQRRIFCSQAALS